MCCFSGKIQTVNDTRIFARMGEQGNQFIAYSMALSTAQDVAMLLPIPVAKGRGDGAVKFISLEKYKNFFDDLAKGYPAARGTFNSPTTAAAPSSAQTIIKVESVGAYDASFVPSLADFSRLDPRFVLPTEVWQQLPGYKDFGFAVFKLKAAVAEVHPMAFSFASAKPTSLFFPTVHIHDGMVHDRATFDHTLYCQPTSEHDSIRWEESPQLASQFMKVSSSQGLIRPTQHVYRKQMSGRLKNQDVMLALG